MKAPWTIGLGMQRSWSPGLETWPGHWRTRRTRSQVYEGQIAPTTKNISINQLWLSHHLLMQLRKIKNLRMDARDLGLTDGASILEEAKAAAMYSLGLQPLSAHECPTQGMASRTVKVDMVDGVAIIVQLRSEPVHEENARQAHEILGKLVPVPVRIIRQSPVPYVYVMPLVSGSTWLSLLDSSAD